MPGPRQRHHHHHHDRRRSRTWSRGLEQPLGFVAKEEVEIPTGGCRPGPGCWSERTQRAWEGTNLGAPVVWFEVAGRDLDVLRQFYGSLFGWRIELDLAAPMPYGLVQTGAEGIPGGIYAPGEPVGIATCRSMSPSRT